MHIPDGLFEAHSLELNLAAAAASALVGGLAIYRGRELDARRAPVLGVTAAFVFAAQMLNFPIAGTTSGHFLGALMAAVLLGPLNAFLVMAVVLTIQCFMFGDGGLTVLGTNIFNMGVVGGLGGYAVFRLVAAILPRTRGCFLAAVAIAAWTSVVASATVCGWELGVTQVVPMGFALHAMFHTHALIGIGEAIITTAAVSLVLADRPDLVASWRAVPTPTEGVLP